MVFVWQLWPQSNSESSSSRQRLARPFSCRVQLSPNSHGVKGYLGSRPPSGVYVRSYHVLQRTSCYLIDSCSFFEVKNWNHQRHQNSTFCIHKAQTAPTKHYKFIWAWPCFTNAQECKKQAIVIDDMILMKKSTTSYKIRRQIKLPWMRLRLSPFKKGTLCTSLDLICILKISQDQLLLLLTRFSIVAPNGCSTLDEAWSRWAPSLQTGSSEFPEICWKESFNHDPLDLWKSNAVSLWLLKSMAFSCKKWQQKEPSPSVVATSWCEVAKRKRPSASFW